jgi:hypothetical protein
MPGKRGPTRVRFGRAPRSRMWTRMWPPRWRSWTWGTRGRRWTRACSRDSRHSSRHCARSRRSTLASHPRSSPRCSRCSCRNARGARPCMHSSRSSRTRRPRICLKQTSRSAETRRPSSPRHSKCGATRPAFRRPILTRLDGCGLPSSAASGPFPPPPLRLPIIALHILRSHHARGQGLCAAGVAGQVPRSAP